MAERGRPKKERQQLVDVPKQFEADSEFSITEMQTAFVWHYTQGGCGQTEAARKAGFSFPAMSASKLMNGRDHPNVVKAIRACRLDDTAKPEPQHQRQPRQHDEE